MSPTCRAEMTIGWRTVSTRPAWCASHARSTANSSAPMIKKCTAGARIQPATMLMLRSLRKALITSRNARCASLGLVPDRGRPGPLLDRLGNRSTAALLILPLRIVRFGIERYAAVHLLGIAVELVPAAAF